jgi:hypothetical protein
LFIKFSLHERWWGKINFSTPLQTLLLKIVKLTFIKSLPIAQPTKGA